MTSKKASEEGANLNIQVHRCKLFCRLHLSEHVLARAGPLVSLADILADDNGAQKEPCSEKDLGSESSGRATSIFSPTNSMFITL